MMVTTSRRLLFFAVPALVALVAAAPAGAATTACPESGDIALAVERAPLAFVGTVKELDPKGGVLLVSVEEIWIGPELEPSVTVANFGDNGGAPIEIANRYLFIPDPMGDLMSVNWCLPPVPMSSEIEALRPAEVTTPSSRDEGETAEPIDLAPFALSAFVIGAIAVSVVAFSVKGPTRA